MADRERWKGRLNCDGEKEKRRGDERDLGGGGGNAPE